MYYVFATPAFEGGFETYITAAIGPITYVIWGFLHQSRLWFRIRNWLKVFFLFFVWDCFFIDFLLIFIDFY